MRMSKRDTQRHQPLSRCHADVVPLMARLDPRSLIDREPMDGRSRALVLAPLGRLLTREIKDVVADHEAALIERIPACARRLPERIA